MLFFGFQVIADEINVNFYFRIVQVFFMICNKKFLLKRHTKHFRLEWVKFFCKKIFTKVVQKKVFRTTFCKICH